MNNKTKLASALIIVLIIIVAAVYFLLPAASAPVTTTTSMTTTVAPAQNSTNASSYPRALNQTTLQSVFGISGAYNSSTRFLTAPINSNTSTLLNITTTQFNFSTHGPTNLAVTFAFPTINYTGYSPAPQYSSLISSFDNYSKQNSIATANQSAAVSGMNYTLFTQQTNTNGIYMYLVGYKGIVLVSMSLSSTMTAPVNSTTANALIAVVAQSA